MSINMTIEREDGEMEKMRMMMVKISQLRSSKAPSKEAMTPQLCIEKIAP